MMDAMVVAVFVGKPRTFKLANGKTWTTSLFKEPMEGQVWLGAEDLEGNYATDRRYHGGPDKAVCCYASEHYPVVRAFLGKAEVNYGAFGENFTLSGLIEDSVCCGDQFQVGDAVVEVSQPRQPCINLARRMERKDFPEWIVSNGVTGWYMRVIKQGNVASGDRMERIARPNPDWTISALNDLMFTDRNNRQRLSEAAVLPQLAESWRQVFEQRAGK